MKSVCIVLVLRNVFITAFPSCMCRGRQDHSAQCTGWLYADICGDNFGAGTQDEQNDPPENQLCPAIGPLLCEPDFEGDTLGERWWCRSCFMAAIGCVTFLFAADYEFIAEVHS